MQSIFSFLMIFFSFQMYAQRYAPNNGMIDVKLVAEDDSMKGNMPFVLFKIELEGEAIRFATSKHGFDTYYSICPQIIENKTLIVTAYRADCDSIEKEVKFDKLRDTALFFHLIPDPESRKTSSEYMIYVDSFQPSHSFYVTSCPSRILEDDAIMLYEHCDGRIAQFDSIPEDEMLSGVWGDLMIPQQIIARCRNKECEWGDSVLYINCIGDTIIPYGKLQFLGSKVILNYGIVSKLGPDGSSKMIGINSNGEEIFDVYIFDNGPDYKVEGRFRIKRNGKIGFANEKGEIVIEPQFECADYFRDGKARVTFSCELVPDGEYSFMKSETWFYIDKDGNLVP